MGGGLPSGRLQQDYTAELPLSLEMLEWRKGRIVKITYLCLSPGWPPGVPGRNASEYKWLIERNGDGLGGKTGMEGGVGNSEWEPGICTKR